MPHPVRLGFKNPIYAGFFICWRNASTEPPGVRSRSAPPISENDASATIFNPVRCGLSFAVDENVRTTPFVSAATTICMSLVLSLSSHQPNISRAAATSSRLTSL